ncbi:MAG: zinc metallopeptidase [Oscillibacter sp.]|nr:zinc metallopeptidase [Oscillibacter sp.]
MPYYYGGYGNFLANNIYILLLIPVMLLSLWAQFQVSGNFKKYSRVSNRRCLTGAQAAEMVLRANGVYDVKITSTWGELTDHYDPRDNTIYLSQAVYSASTVAAVGVAAHEAGHAVQYAVGYAPIRLRSAIVPLTNLGSRCSVILLFIGLLLYSQSLFLVGILLFSLTTFFQLVTLPVEFNASRRALETIEGWGILDGEELNGARKVLRAAALTYVAALLMSALQLLRYVLIFLGRANQGDRRGQGRR